ncbi:hypothetical protein PYCC9005_005388 [Savitreella phatthalungensis]
MEEGDEIDLFGENGGQSDADSDSGHFFLPHHFQGDGDVADGYPDLSNGIEAADDFFQLPQATASQVDEDASNKKLGEFADIGAHFREMDDNLSLQSSGLGDEDLPEEEEPTGEREDFNYEDLIKQAQKDVEPGDVDADNGPEISLPDFGGLPPQASGQMAKWMAGVKEATDALDQAIPDVHMLGDSELTNDEILERYYPSFKPGAKLKFTELFAMKSKFRIAVRKAPRSLVPVRAALELEPDQRLAFVHRNKRVRLDRMHSGIITTESIGQQLGAHSNTPEDDAQSSIDLVSDLSEGDADLILACTSWDDVLDRASNATEPEPALPRLSFLRDEDLLTPLDIETAVSGRLRPVAQLDLNDDHLLVRKAGASEDSRRTTAGLLQRLAWSNDEVYERLRSHSRRTVRSNLTQFEVAHAGFAERLQSPFYRTSLNKSEQRAFHRPAMLFKPNQEMRFSRLRKRPKTKVRDPRILMPLTKDISLADSTGFALLEYSEEYPAVLSNTGMGSKIVNYYRKRTDDDEYRPKGGFGEAHVIAPTDGSPFWTFGHVEHGETVPTLYNRMIRAPVFKHNPEPTDFLLLRDRTRSSGDRCYLRLIKHVFTVGQLFPIVEIPGPHSRRVTTAAKNRLKMVTYRIMRRNDLGRIIVKDLIKHFPEQNESQLRQRLKDFMEYNRVKGEDMGYWRLKDGDILPSEEGTRSMVDPETVCLVDAMQAGLRQLEDAGYGKAVDGDDDKDDNLDIEQMLAPWLTSRNFINATQGKAMLQLNGEGDPTGRGEGFSFVRTSMKGGFRSLGGGDDTDSKPTKGARAGHSYNVADQQRAYEDEISRIWNSQKATLSMSGAQVLDRDALEAINRENDGTAMGSPAVDSGSAAQTPADTSVTSDGDDDNASLASGMSGSVANKVLRITRVVRNEYGEPKSTTEVITNPHVIHAYVKKRRQMHEARMAEDFVNGTPEEIAARQRKKVEDELARLKRNQERRQARKNARARQNAKLQAAQSSLSKTVEISDFTD